MVCTLLVVAYIANRLSRLTRVPDLVVLLLIGVTLGPVLHWVRPAMFQGAIDILPLSSITPERYSHRIIGTPISICGGVGWIGMWPSIVFARILGCPITPP